MHNLARPKANLNLTEKVQLFVRAWCMDREKRVGGLPFCMDAEPVTAHDLSDPDTLLPVIGWHCARIYGSSGFKTRLDVEFPARTDAYLKLGVRFERFSRPDSELMLFLAETLEDAANNLPRPDPSRPSANLRLLTDQFLGAMRDAKASHAAKPATA